MVQASSPTRLLCLCLLILTFGLTALQEAYAQSQALN
jgi:hypothetical protein